MKSSPGLTVTTGGMSGCQRLCSGVGCSVGGFLMSTEMIVLAMLSSSFLDLQMLLHDVVGELADVALRDDSAGVENRETLGDVADEIEALLDQQNRAIPLAQECA